MNLRTAVKAVEESSSISDGIGMKQLQFESGVCVMVENTTSNSQLKATVKFDNTNLEIVGSPKDASELAITLNPGADNLIVLRVVEPGSFSFGMSFAEPTIART